jgi:hypothetical protein
MSWHSYTSILDQAWVAADDISTQRCWGGDGYVKGKGGGVGVAKADGSEVGDVKERRGGRGSQ